jgi:DNA-binding transcriptional MerR regulator
MEEDMIMNVPSAPEMQGTPMTPDLSMEMQSEMGDMTQNEIQEAQGALMQILQVINMLIEQGLNPEQIKAFLEQYGISEEELEQAAQALGVDIDMVLSGQMQAPQEPMMMAEGGPGVLDPNDLPDNIKTQLENIYRKLYLANPEKDRNRRRADYTQLTEEERELHKQYLTGKLRRDAPLIAKYMDLIGFDNIGDDNPLLAGAKVASIALGLSGALPTSRIRRKFNPDAGILSDPIRDKALAERKEIYGYATGGPGLDEKKN